jgi:L-threonylcarbamoyladenylate synthase
MTQVSQSELISQAKLGNIVSFPTDTVPALAVKPEASQLIFNLKKRSQDKPLILMAASFEEFLPYIQGTDQELTIWQEIAAKYLPGALTLVLPASAKVPQVMNPNHSNTIGVRVPDLKLAQDILGQTQPLATTSANLSGQPPLEIMAEIDQVFPEVFTLKDDNFDQIVGSGQPSTVAKWTGQGWQILRQGSVNLNTIS